MGGKRTNECWETPTLLTKKELPWINKINFLSKKTYSEMLTAGQNQGSYCSPLPAGGQVLNAVLWAHLELPVYFSPFHRSIQCYQPLPWAAGTLVEEHCEGQTLVHEEYRTKLSYSGCHSNYMFKSLCHLGKNVNFQFWKPFDLVTKLMVD